MSDFIIYHNPRCSKSRQTLELLKNNNITPLIRLYLEDPPNKRELKGILEKLNKLRQIESVLMYMLIFFPKELRNIFQMNSRFQNMFLRYPSVSRL